MLDVHYCISSRVWYVGYERKVRPSIDPTMRYSTALGICINLSVGLLPQDQTLRPRSIQSRTINVIAKPIDARPDSLVLIPEVARSGKGLIANVRKSRRWS